MKRRAFLTMLGLAPVVAQALPRPANPVELAKGGPITKAKYLVGEKPFVFESGELYMTNVCTNTITAGILRSKDNKFSVDLSNRRITFRD